MPVFWPVLEKSVSAIFVTHEVHVTEHRRLEDNDNDYELVHSRSLGRPASVKSDGGHSRETLHRHGKNGQDDYYNDTFVAAQVAPIGAEQTMGHMGLETNVQSKPDRGPKWNL
jgi:hypothetical protein